MRKSLHKTYCSFICAFYNREKYLKKSIQSILSQSYQDFELIVVNDGSTDNCIDIIKGFNDERLKYFYIEHSGCWKAKNYAINQSSSEFLCFIDSDDFISNDFYMNAVLEIKTKPDYDYYYPTSLSIAKADGSPTNQIWRYIDYQLENRKELIHLFWERQIGGIPHAAAFIKRDVFSKFSLYNDTFFNLSDTAYIISHALDIKFCLLNNLKTYYNRQHEQQTNTNFKERTRTFSEIMFEIADKYQQILIDNYKLKPNHYLDFVIARFMDLAEKSEHKQYYLDKAEYFLRKKRNEV